VIQPDGKLAGRDLQQQAHVISQRARIHPAQHERASQMTIRQERLRQDGGQSGLAQRMTQVCVLVREEQPTGGR
jgi:hypothetical protein